MAKTKEALRSIRGLWQSYRSVPIPIDKILRGGELGFSSKAISIHYEDLLWGSKLAVPSPHSLLLQDYQKEGEQIFENDRFLATEYYKYGSNCIDHFYNFFEAYQKESIIKVAKHFVNRVFHPDKINIGNSSFTCYSNKHSPILVSPIVGSSYFQLKDGYHRLAQSYFSGKTEVFAYVKNKAVLTPFQKILLFDSRSYGKMELHQQLEAPEIEGWPIRMPMNLINNEIENIIKLYLSSSNKNNLSSLDVGSRYGWLVKAMKEKGHHSKGLENDYVCLLASRLLNKLDENQIIKGDIFDNLPKQGKFDIVTCLDELPRCLLNASIQLPDDFLRSLASVTNHTLIVSMGEIYRGSPHPKLSEWSLTKTVTWLKNSNLFNEVMPIEIPNHNPLFVCYK